MAASRFRVLVVIAPLIASACLPLPPRQPGFTDRGDAPSILLVGDSWAAHAATDSVEGSGYGTFESALAERGWERVAVRSEYSAATGTTAAQWARPESLWVLHGELTKDPAIRYVHLVVGGNDFLAISSAQDFPLLPIPDREQLYDEVIEHIETICTYLWDKRPELEILLADYDYLDAEPAAEMGFNPNGLTTGELNRELVALGRRKLELSRSREQLHYLHNWGLTQHAFDLPSGTAPPAGAPDYEPYPGGDPEQPMPPAAHIGDGIHPNEEGQRLLIEHAFEEFYDERIGPLMEE